MPKLSNNKLGPAIYRSDMPFLHEKTKCPQRKGGKMWLEGKARGLEAGSGVILRSQVPVKAQAIYSACAFSVLAVCRADSLHEFTIMRFAHRWLCLWIRLQWLQCEGVFTNLRKMDRRTRATARASPEEFWFWKGNRRVLFCRISCPGWLQLRGGLTVLKAMFDNRLRSHRNLDFSVLFTQQRQPVLRFGSIPLDCRRPILRERFRPRTDHYRVVPSKRH